PGRNRLGGSKAAGGALGKPERFLLRARPQDRGILVRKTLRKAVLERGFRRERTSAGIARREAERFGNARLARNHGGGKLVAPFLRRVASGGFHSLSRSGRYLLPARAGPLHQRRALRGKRSIPLRAEPAANRLCEGYRRQDRQRALADCPRLRFGEF